MDVSENMKSDDIKINRLILVGNGFDLAHGLKTSYNHFMLDYVISAFSQAGMRDTPFIDEVFEISTGDWRYNFPYDGFPSIAEIITNLYNEGNLKSLFNGERFRNANSRSIDNYFKVKFKMPFIEHLIKNCSFNNWVDIENEFYDTLKHILEKPSKNGKATDLLALNNSMRWIIGNLEKYLTDISKQGLFNDDYTKLVYAPVDIEDFADQEFYSADNISIGLTMILTFNYTVTFKQYVSNINILDSNVSINHIHGQINNSANPIVFGFGDELDNDYAKLELERVKGWFDFIKSFWYFKTSNYYNLIRFIDANDFQVYILGHSCGLSDRTMLNMIFEHPRCKSIKIFYHGTVESNNYTSLTQEISRHFKDKRLMRRRIVSLDRSSPMPQCI